MSQKLQFKTFGTSLYLRNKIVELVEKWAIINLGSSGFRMGIFSPKLYFHTIPPLNEGGIKGS